MTTDPRIARARALTPELLAWLDGQLRRDPDAEALAMGALIEALALCHAGIAEPARRRKLLRQSRALLAELVGLYVAAEARRRDKEAPAAERKRAPEGGPEHTKPSCSGAAAAGPSHVVRPGRFPPKDGAPSIIRPPASPSPRPAPRTDFPATPARPAAEGRREEQRLAERAREAACWLLNAGYTVHEGPGGTYRVGSVGGLSAEDLIQVANDRRGSPRRVPPLDRRPAETEPAPPAPPDTDNYPGGVPRR